MNYAYVTQDVDGAVATVTLNRPERRNAFDDRLIAELAEVFGVLNADPSIRAVILRGAGKSFCAGADLEWMGRMAGFSQAENLADAARAEEMFDAIAASPKVTIAAVHGAALGGGAGLTACCDVTIAIKGTMFAFSEVRLGIAPAIIAPYVIGKIGSGHARALFLTGRRFDSTEAHRIGLVQQVVEDDRALDNAVQATVDDVLQSGPLAIAATKSLMHDLQGKTAARAARKLTTQLIASLRVSEEGQEGLKAFLEKRKPKFAE